MFESYFGKFVQNLVISNSNQINLTNEYIPDGLERLLPPVHVVAQEQVVGLGREPAVLEEAQQVGVLPVDVT